MDTRGLLKKDSEKRKRWLCFNKISKFHVLQVLVALGGGLSSLAPGMTMGFSAVALPQLRPTPHKGTTTFPVLAETIVTTAINSTLATVESVAVSEKFSLTNEEAAWFSSITMATTPLGCLVAGYLNDQIGRKGALIAVAAPGLVAWLMLATVPSVAAADFGYPRIAILVQMILGRALNGITIGMASSPACILAGETSAPSLRGSVICVNTLAISAGILMVYFLGEVMSGWRMVAAVGAIVTGLVTLVSLTLPESPVWLRSRGRGGDADWVCTQLGLRSTVATNGGGTFALRKEGGTRKRGIGATDRVKKFGGIMETVRLLMEPGTLRPLLLLTGLFLFQQASGVFVVTFNAVEIAESSGIAGSIIDGNMTAVLMGACTFLVVTFVCLFIDRWGRRPAAILSGLGMSISMAVLAVYVHMEMQNLHPHSKSTRVFLMPESNRTGILFPHHAASENISFGGFLGAANTTTAEPDGVSNFVHETLQGPTPDSWIPLVALLTWACSSALGFMPLPWAIPAELLPSRSRGIGFGILSAMAYVFGFIAVRAFASLVYPFGLANCMFVMSASAAGGAAYVAALLPETRGVILDGLDERRGRWREVHSSLNLSSTSNTETESSDLNA